MRACMQHARWGSTESGVRAVGQPARLRGGSGAGREAPPKSPRSSCSLACTVAPASSSGCTRTVAWAPPHPHPRSDRPLNGAGWQRDRAGAAGRRLMSGFQRGGGKAVTEEAAGRPSHTASTRLPPCTGTSDSPASPRTCTPTPASGACPNDRLSSERRRAVIDGRA